MRIHIFSFTNQGAELSTKLYHLYIQKGYDCVIYTLAKFALSDSLTALSKSLAKQVEESFSREDALVFIGACGIAVRSIAPYLKSKTTDPCVIVIDEKEQFVISLLSGHLGGGNEFTQETARLLHSIPIISTSTDLNDKFSVDMFAKKNCLEIKDMVLAKEISSLVLQEKKVGFHSMFPFSQPLPEDLIPLSQSDNTITTGISITCCIHENPPFKKTLYLIPKQIILGIGCKKNTSCSNIETLVLTTLNNYHIPLSALHGVSTIDLKKEEPGLLEFCEKFHLPFNTYSSEQLQQAEGCCSSSHFVKEITGVDNVCERAALLSAKTNQLYFPKTSAQGVTVAGALRPLTITF